MQRTLIFLIGAAALISVFLGAPFEAISSPFPPAKYHPVSLYEGDMAKPGLFAWSPDGRHLAFAGKSIGVYETPKGKIRNVNIRASFLTWYGNGNILAISQEAGRNVLNMIDTVSLRIKKIRLDFSPDAVFVSADRRTILLLKSRIRIMFIGTSVGYSLFAYDLRDGKTRRIYDSDIIYPTRKPNIGLLHAWFHAGLDPAGDSLLLMEQVKPPAMIRPFTRVIGIGSSTGRRLSIAGKETGNTYISGGWSPDGGSVVLTDSGGHMEIYSLKKGLTYEDDAIYGLYPSWNPRGSRIYLGGYVIDADGSNREEVFAGCHESLAEWSPDGTKLAVAAENRLWLLGGFDPHSMEPDVRKGGTSAEGPALQGTHEKSLLKNKSQAKGL